METNIMELQQDITKNNNLIDVDDSQQIEQGAVGIEAKESCQISLPSGYNIALGSSVISADRLLELSLQTLKHLHNYSQTKSGTNYTG